MQLVLELLLVVLSLVIVVEDFRYRAIRWWILPLLAIVGVAIQYASIRITDILVNLGFVFIQLIMLTVYFSAKNKRYINITKQYLGLGDILFWLVLCLLFSSLNFIVFFMLSMLWVLFVSILIRIVAGDQWQRAIPLAGIQGIALIVAAIFNFIIEADSFRNDDWVEKIIIQ